MQTFADSAYFPTLTRETFSTAAVLESQTLVNLLVIQCPNLFLRIQQNSFGDFTNHEKVFNLKLVKTLLRRRMTNYYWIIKIERMYISVITMIYSLDLLLFNP